MTPLRFSEGLTRGLHLRAAARTLSAAGFRVYVMERGTLCAYKGTAAYGFQPHGNPPLYNDEAITRAIKDNPR